MPIEPGRDIVVADEHPDNRGVLAYLRSDQGGQQAPLSARPDSAPDPYQALGTHPDIVEHLWDRIGPTLPEDCRCVVAGTPALVEPASGLVLAVGLGTSYALRLAPVDFEQALATGAPTAHHYTGSGGILDVGAWGRGWRFGAFDDLDGARLGRACAHAAALGGRRWSS